MQGISDKASLTVGSRQLRDAEGVAHGARRLIFAVSALAICFALPLWELVQLALKEEIHSHLILIPLISLYLIWQIRPELPRPRFTFSPGALFATVPVAAALLIAPHVFHSVGPMEVLSLRILAFCVLLQAVLFTVGGRDFFRSILFPAAFMFFMVPLPPSIIEPLETASKVASAEVFTWMMDLTGSTYVREGFVFALPGLNIEVAQECSGIRSSLVLFIVSVLASHLFLRTSWKRIVFSLFVIPLGVARNAFRIFVLSALSVHWDRSVIDSPLHHKGGPLFFAVSLVPFFLVLFWLRKTEGSSRKGPSGS